MIVNAAVMRIDFDLGAHHDRPAFLRSNGPALRGVHDRQAERGALIFFGQVDLAAGDGERVTAQADADDCFTDQAFRATGPRVRLRFSAQLHARQQARDARRDSAAARTGCPAGHLRGESVVTSGVNDPALMFVVSDASVGVNGSVLATARRVRHRLRWGPSVMSNCEVDWSTSWWDAV